MGVLFLLQTREKLHVKISCERPTEICVADQALKNNAFFVIVSQ